MPGSQGALAARLVADTAQFKAEMVSAANVSEKELKRAAKATQYVNDYLKEMARLQRDVGASTDGFQKVAKEAAKLGQATQISAGQTANAMRMLPAQLTDVVTQLAGGQSPLLILVQQGGQVKDSFGGVGNALRALGSLVTPATVALAVLAVTIGSVGLAAYQGYQEQQAFNKSLQLTGNFAGVTADEMTRLARATSAATGKGISTTREALQALISTGQVGPAVLGPAGDAVVRLQKLTGESAEKIAVDFAKMGEGVAKWAEDHNKAWNFITAEQYAYIKRLEEQGQKEQAQIEVYRLINQHLRDTGEGLNTLGKLWESVGRQASEAWDSMKGIGRTETVDQQIARVTKELSTLQSKQQDNSFFGFLFGGGDVNVKLEETAAQLEALKRQKVGEAMAVQMVAANAATEKARIAAVDYIEKIREETKGVDLVAKKIAEYRRQVELLKGTQNEVSAADQKNQEAAIRKKYNPDAAKKDDQLASAIKARMEALGEENARLDDQIASWEKYGRVVDKSRVAVLLFDTAQGKLKNASGPEKLKLFDLASEADRKDAVEKDLQLRAKVNKQLAESEILTAAYVDRIDAETASLGKTAVESKIAADGYQLMAEAKKLALEPGADSDRIYASFKAQSDLRAAATRRNYDAQRTFEYGARQSFKAFMDDAGNAAKNASTLIDGTLNQLTDALVNFAKTGKLNLGDLWTFMADEFLRQQARMVVASATSGGLGGLLGLLGGGGSAGSPGVSWTDGTFSAASTYANGLSYVPYDGFPAVLHEGERVMTRQENAGGAANGVTIDQSGAVYNVGQGVSRGEMQAAAQSAAAQAEARIYRSLRIAGAA